MRPPHVLDVLGVVHLDDSAHPWGHRLDRQDRQDRTHVGLVRRVRRADDRGCGIGDSGFPFYTDQAWHFSHVCDDVYRLSVFPETIGRERQLAAVGMGAIPGTELESVDGTGSNEPHMLFHTRLRDKGSDAMGPTWEIAPVHADRLCFDQDMDATWGTRVLPRVVLNDCQEVDPKQSWELVAVPRGAR